MGAISFHPSTQNNLKQVLEWLRKPHVTKWYHGAGLQNTITGLQRLADGKSHHFEAWVASIQDQPFALVMSYDLTEQDRLDPDCYQAKWMESSKSHAGLDLLIGEESFLGKGLAASLISNFIVEKLSHADTIFIDPEKTNTRAIHVYEKVGFEVIDEFIASWNPVPHVLMRLTTSIK